MLSSSVSDEIHTGTLSVLMTTPISSFQIVIGKLLSKLLQLVILLAISLPLLAIVRILGGVPWDYVISTVCITLTATFLAGALSFLLSMTYRHAYMVILVTMVVYMVFFGALPGLFNMLAVKGIFLFDKQATQSLLAMTNPFVAFAASNARFIQSGVPSFFSWPLHCLLMLAVASVFIAVAVCRVRKAATARTFSPTAKQQSAGKLERMLTRIFYKSGFQALDKSIVTVTGPPVFWKEMRKGFVGRRKGEVVIFILLIAVFLSIAVLQLLSSGRNSFLPRYFMSAFYIVVMIRMAVSSAGSIAGEKEARTWPVLLTTPLENKEIVRGKAIAAFRRNFPLLLLYIILISISYIKMAGIKSILVIILYLLLPIATSVLFVIGAGLYFGVRMKTSTLAIAATVGSYITLSYFVLGMLLNPLRIIFFSGIYRAAPNYPFIVQLLTVALSIIPTLALGGIGIFLKRRAVRQLRHNIF
jgi:ABC-type transport system involved in multi-copper enzyme maturation permease subunit